MDTTYFFWNAGNLLAILTAVLGGGLLLGSILSIIIAVITQVEDRAVSFFANLSGCMLSTYIFSGFIFSSIKVFTERVWFATDIFK